MTAFGWIWVPLLFSGFAVACAIIPGILDDIIAWILAGVVWMAWFGTLIYELGTHVGTVILALGVLVAVVLIVWLITKWRSS
jgi:hypothetical protein